MNEPSYLNYHNFHQFLDAIENNSANYPQRKDCDDAVKHFATSCTRTNSAGQTPLMRLAAEGLDDLAQALVKRHPKTAKAIDWNGRPVWYYLVNDEELTPDPKSILMYQQFLEFPPLKNGDRPLHMLARGLISNTRMGFQHKEAFMAFVNDPDDLIVSNQAGERPIDIVQHHLHLFDPDEQNLLQEILNSEQNARLSSAVRTKGGAASARKI